MRYVATINSKLGQTDIEVAGNCYTDALPMLRIVSLRRQSIDINSPMLPLACAILTRRYCGDQFEFVGMKIGQDYGEAIREIVDANVNVAGVDGHGRSLCTGEVDIIAQPAFGLRAIEVPAAEVAPHPLERIDWSGDFVSGYARCSSSHPLGMYYTNAGFFADATAVSIAMGLLHGRERCRRVLVPAGRESDDLPCLRRALAIVGVDLVVL